MCFIIPIEVVNVNGKLAICRDMMGKERKVDLSLLDTPIVSGDFVTVHMGCAVERVSPEDREVFLDLLRSSGIGRELIGEELGAFDSEGVSC